MEELGLEPREFDPQRPGPLAPVLCLLLRGPGNRGAIPEMFVILPVQPLSL